MTNETHPDELELLSYVEDELADTPKHALADHVRACPACSARVRELETARDALRAAPPLELPPERSARIRAELAAKEPEKRPRISPARLTALVAPVAVAVALIVAVASLDLGGGGGGGGDGAAEEAAQTGPMERKADQEAGGAEKAAPQAAPTIAAVRGPAPDVAGFLRARGYDARVAGPSTVAVRGADPNDLARALARRPAGPVQVVLE
jgi:hypothetical protein